MSTKEPIANLLEKHHSKDQYLESVFLELAKKFSNKIIDQDLLQSIDKAIIKGHPDPNLFLLFISLSVSYNCEFNQLEKAKSLCSIADSFSFEEIPPLIKAVFIQSRAKLLHMDGQIIETAKLMNQSVSFLNKAEPRSYFLLQNYLSMNAIKGQLKERNEYKLSQLNELSPQDQDSMSIHLKLINCIVTGNHQEGFALIGEFKKQIKGGNSPLFEQFNNLLKINSGDFEEASYQENLFKYMSKAFECFSSGRIEEAMKYHQALLKEKMTLSYLNLSFSYIPLNFEICSRRIGKAKLLLQEKTKKGDIFYLDDLFYGRLQLLENDEEGANASFSRLIENVNRYGAMNRLEFELQFAKEMKLPVIMRLMNGWPAKTSEILFKKKKEEPVKLFVKEKEKGIKLLVGKSAAINQVKDLVKKYAALKAPVLVTGETGTGKELVSRALHDEGLFPNEPFLAINCGALTDTLLQSELFGYEAGAFTGAQKQRKGIFEAAGKGTVLLDEFGDISSKLQVSLLRVLEANEIRLIGSTTTRQIECKIVIATNVDLQNAVIEKKFREDLFFRLARFEIKLPSLRERVEDIPELIHYFLLANSNRSDKSKSLSTELLNTLTAYHWPGNIRELKNEMERLYILNPGLDVLSLEHFDFTHLQTNTKMTPKTQAIIPSLVSNLKESITKNEAVLKIIQNGFRVEKRHALLIELFKEYKKLTRSQIMKATNVGPATATKDLQSLMDAGFIVRRSPTKSTSTDYFEIVPTQNIFN